MTLQLHGTTEDCLRRIARLEQFKETEVNGSIAWTMRKEIRTKKLVNANQYICKKERSLEDEHAERNQMWENDEADPAQYGPDENGDYFTQKQADQINMAVAIKKIDLEYLENEFFNPETVDYKYRQMNYCTFKHVFFWLLDEWTPENENLENIFSTLLEKVHQVDQLFYHWAWYVFPRILDFYRTPEQKIKFLYKCIDINNTDHVWNNLPDHPAKISLGRRPRPIMQLIHRLAAEDGTNKHTWTKFYATIKGINQKDPDYIKKFWRYLKLELIEARTSSIWETAGKGFEQEPKIPTLDNIKWNLPLHVFMNPPVKYLPYMAQTIWEEAGSIPNIMFTAMELQCFYCTTKCKTFKTIEQIFTNYLNDYKGEETIPFNKDKIKKLGKACRSQNRIF